MFFLCLSLVVVLIIQPEVYNYGQVEEGDTVRAIFWLKNPSSTDTVVIKSIRPSCGCTYTTYSSGKILPGDSLILEAVFNTKGYSGEVTEYVKISLLSPEKKEIYLTLKGTVNKRSIDPEALQRYYVLIFDLRERRKYDREHLVGSIWIQKDRFDEEFKKLRVPKGTMIVLISDSQKDKEILEYLRKEGFGNSYMLRDGFEGWKRVMKFTLVESRD